MPDLLGYIKGYIPETYKAMVTAGYDGESDVDVIARKTAVIIDRLYVDGTAEDDMGEFVKDYTAALIVREVISSAIDYWQVRGDRSRTAPAGVGPVGGETVQYYDRVDGLLKIDERLKQKLVLDKAEFIALANGLLRNWGTATAPPTGMAVSSRSTDMKTLDPDDFDPLLGGRLTKPPFATVLVIQDP
jgi:hypothetical protein